MRDGSKATIPVALLAFVWVSTAAWVHLGLGLAGYDIGVRHDDANALTTFAEHIGGRVDAKQRPMEIALDDSSGSAPPVDTTEPAPPPAPTETAKKDQPKPPPTAKPAPSDEPKKPEDKKVAVVPTATTAAATPPPPPPPSDKRIAVKQHAKDNQEDNPNAAFIADQANHVDQETAANLTSHDRDDENPTPAGAHQNASKDPGDSETQKIADSDEHKGDHDRAPGEHGTELTIQHDPPPDHAMGPVAVQGPVNPSNVSPQSGGDGKAPAPMTDVQPQLVPGNQAPPTPGIADSQNGGWSFSIARAPGTSTAQDTGPGATSRTLQPPPAVTGHAFGLGGNPGAGQVNLNLDNHGVVAAVGRDQLRKERDADGERRLSEHRGSWQASNFERWRSAIENYVSSVKPGNQTALNTAAVPFASYLNGMHNRIHPIFADSFLGSLDGLPPTNPLNDQRLITRLEIVLSKEGRVVKMGIVKTSGVTAFDIAALDAVQRASPYGAAPGAIVSPDGQVYLHWEFHRDEVYACSTMNARPFMLNTPAGTPPVDPNPVPKDPSGPQEKGAATGDTRQGLWILPRQDTHVGG